MLFVDMPKAIDSKERIPGTFVIFRSSGEDLVSIDAGPKIDSDRPASPKGI